MTETMTLNYGTFEPLAFDELFEVDGGVNWDRVFAGATVYLAATAGILVMTTPIGWGVAACYLATCAISGAYIGYGIRT